MSDKEPRQIHVIPTEKIVRKKDTFIGYSVIGAETETEVEEARKALALATGDEVLKENELPASVRKTSMLNINYNNPNASTWFKDKKWSVSNN